MYISINVFFYISYQVSLLVFHPWSSDEMVLLTPPVTKATEEVVGEKPADGVADYIYINRLPYPEPIKDKNISKESVPGLTYRVQSTTET